MDRRNNTLNYTGSLVPALRSGSAAERSEGGRLQMSKQKMRDYVWSLAMMVLGHYLILASFIPAAAHAETSGFPPTVDSSPLCDQLSQQFSANVAAKTPPEFFRYLQNQLTVIMGGTPPASACHDADVYWQVRSATNAIQRRLVLECNGVWRDQKTGTPVLSKSNIEQSYGDEERDFNEFRQKMCVASGNKAN